MRTLRIMRFLLLTLIVSSNLMLVGATITLRSEGLPAARCLIQVEALAGKPLLLAPELLERGVDNQPLWFALHDADLPVACEALAQGMATWWLRTAQDRILFTDQVHIPLGPLTTLTRPSSLEQHEDLLVLLQQALSPWLGPGTGLVAHPSKNRIIATLDDAGHTRLLILLNILESGNARLPPLLSPLPPALLPASASWSALLDQASPEQNICQGFGFPPEVPPPFPLPVWRSSSPELIVVSRNFRPRQHPAARLRLAFWPIPHFDGNNVETGRLLAERLKTAVGQAAWNEPGSLITYWPPGRGLLIQADDAMLWRLAERLQQWDTAEQGTTP